MEERSERCSGSKHKGEENEQWITKTSVLPHLFSFLLDFLRLLVVLQAILFPPSLPPSSCSLFLFPSPYFPRCRSSAASLITVSFSLLLYLSPSLSLRRPPVFLFIAHSYEADTVQTMGPVLDMVLHCLFVRGGPFPHIGKKKNKRKDHKDMWRSVEGS